MEKHDDEVAGLKQRVFKQVGDFKTEREHCYVAIARLEMDLRQFQELNQVAERTLEARAEKIRRLLQEKGVIKERVRAIAGYITSRCSHCEGMTKSMFFATAMTFFRQVMKTSTTSKGV